MASHSRGVAPGNVGHGRHMLAAIVGGMLKPGDKAPDFTLLDQDENEFTLSKAGTKVLVYFYPD